MSKSNSWKWGKHTQVAIFLFQDSKNKKEKEITSRYYLHMIKALQRKMYNTHKYNHFQFWCVLNHFPSPFYIHLAISTKHNIFRPVFATLMLTTLAWKIAHQKKERVTTIHLTYKHHIVCYAYSLSIKRQK